MNILGLITKLLFAGAVSQYGQKQADKALIAIQDSVKDYLMAYYRGPIVDLLEQEWIMTYKIEPKVKQMSPKELDAIVKRQKKNEALIKKGKPAKYTLVSNEIIRKHHIEYLEYKQKMARAAEEQERMKKQAEIMRVHDLRMRQMREASILVNGESDSEIANKFFD